DGVPLKPYAARVNYGNKTKIISSISLNKNDGSRGTDSGRHSNISSTSSLNSDSSRSKNSTLSRSSRRRNQVFALSRNSSTVVRPDPGGGYIPEKRRKRKKKSRQKNRDRKVKRKERRRHKNGRRRER
ncbi:unnamed protein product, partial [Meganyctiphanes norvegica]